MESIPASGLGPARPRDVYSEFPPHDATRAAPTASNEHPNRALTNKHNPTNLRVYARPDDSDVYADSLFATASQKDANDHFQPTLIVLGIRLGIDRITPVYHAALKAALEMPQTVGIAGGRPSSSHYFIGHQGSQFFYLDPHSTRGALSPQPTEEEAETCHTRRVRRLGIEELDPSMLMGFLIHSKEEFEEWRREIEKGPGGGKAIIHVYDREPTFAAGGGGGGVERPGAVDEVETWDETGGEEEAEVRDVQDGDDEDDHDEAL